MDTNKNLTKRILAVLLSAFIIITYMPGLAYAAQDTPSGDDPVAEAAQGESSDPSEGVDETVTGGEVAESEENLLPAEELADETEQVEEQGEPDSGDDEEETETQNASAASIDYMLSDGSNALTIYEYEIIDNEYNYYPDYGDQLVVTTSDGSKTYTFEEDYELFMSADEDVITLNDVTFEQIRCGINDEEITWTAGGPYYIEVTYAYDDGTTTATAKTNIEVHVQASNVSDITFAPKATSITLYDGVDGWTENGNFYFDVRDIYDYLYGFENDELTIQYSDGTSDSVSLDEVRNWEYVTMDSNNEYVPLFEAQEEDLWTVGTSYYVFLKAMGSIDTDHPITVTIETSPVKDFSFEQSTKYLYVFNGGGEEQDIEYDASSDEYYLGDGSYNGYAGAEGDVLTFEYEDGTKKVFKYGRIENDPDYPYGWDGFVTDDGNGNKSRLEREITFDTTGQKWTPNGDGQGHYYNNTVELNYMGALSNEKLKSYVGYQVWFYDEYDENEGEYITHANSCTPIGMSFNESGVDIFEPERDGYTLIGWYEMDQNGELVDEPYNFDEPVTKETFLYAKWTEDDEPGGPEVEVEDFSFTPAEPITYIAHTKGGIVSEDYDDPETGEYGGEHEYFRYDTDYDTVLFNKGDTFRVNGTEYTYRQNDEETYGYYSDEGEMFDPEDVDISDDQSYENQWTPENDGKITLTYGGKSCVIPVTITENPVTNVAFEFADGSSAVELIEGFDGEVDTDWSDDEEPEFFRYFFPGFKEGDKLTVTKNGEDYEYICQEDVFDGEDYVIAFVNVSDSDDVIYDYEIDTWDSGQSANDPWTAGGEGYFFEFEYYGVSFNVPVTIAENPVASFEFRQGNKYLYVFDAGEGAEVVYDSEDDKYYIDSSECGYAGSEGDSFIVTYKDGSVFEYEYGRTEDDPDFPYGWDGFVTTVYDKKVRLDREITFDARSLTWEKDTDGHYTNNDMVLKYMGVPNSSSDPVVTYVGYQVWFFDEFDEVEEEYISHANSCTPIGMSFNESGVDIFEPVRDGYTLVGWYEMDPNGELENTPYDFDSKVYAETYLYAKWDTAEVHTHELVKVDAKDASCTEDGNAEYWFCSGCDKYFSDADGEHEIANNSWVIEALGHVEALPPVRENVVDPTYTKEGSYDEVVYCTVCGQEIHREIRVIEALEVEETGADVSFVDNISEEDKEAVSNVTASVQDENLVEAAKAAADEVEVTAADGLGALQREGLAGDASAEDVSIVIRTYLEMEIQTVNRAEGSDEIKSVTIEITPKVSVIAALDETNIVIGTNAVVVEEQPITVNKATKVEIRLPEAFADSNVVYVWHNGEEYEASPKDGESATFVFSTNGFSPFVFSKEHTHKLTAHAGEIPACETAGNSAYWSCSSCGKCFSDANAENEIEEGSWVIEATGHTLVKVAATAKNIEYYKCSKCGKCFSDAAGTKEIYESSTVINATATVRATTLPLKKKQKVSAAANLVLPAGVSVKSVTSSNTKILTVSGTTLKGKKKGKSVVTCTLTNGTTAKYTVKVQNGKVKANITGVPKSLTLHVGETYQIKADKGYVTCTYKLKYTSSKKKVAKVSTKGLVTAKKKGTAKITVKCGSKKKTVKVNVIP